MNNQPRDNAFNRFYVWATEAKVTMGLFFAFFVFMYLFLGLMIPGPDIELDFFTALEILFAAFFVGVAQQALLPGGDKLTKVRCILWVVLGSLITIGFSLVFQWFVNFPLWCPIVFIPLTAIGMGAMIYYYYLKYKMETRQLNKKLEQYQKQKK